MSESKNLLVTGASSGVGFETALHLSRAGHRVIALARNSGKLADLKLKAGNNLIPLSMDLNEGDFSPLADCLMENGMREIYGVVHNAGMLINKSFGSITAKELHSVYATNVFAPFLLSEFLLPYLEKAQGAHIVHISSVGGVQGSVKFPGLSAYSSSKGALSLLTECLAAELSKQQIHVNCLALGAVQTEMLTQAFPGYKAPLQADEMGEFVAWFTLNGNRFFNGKILPVALSTP
jgi:NAD(P)-dependent dehydrogenase (short-subunit alcohol dehydrogenase family)